MANNKTLSRDQEPSFGKFTWAQEGEEGGRNHSRKPHVPSKDSGVTIGRGYDMKYKTSKEVEADLKSIGVKTEYVEKLKQCAGKTIIGQKAKEKIEELGLKDVDVLDPNQQLKLFKISYAKESREAARVCSLPKVKENSGDCSWGSMNQHLKEFIVDLKYQGLYKPIQQKSLQEAISNRDYDKIKRIINEKLPKTYEKRNKGRIKLIEDAQRFDKYNRMLPAQLNNNNIIA